MYLFHEINCSKSADDSSNLVSAINNWQALQMQGIYYMYKSTKTLAAIERFSAFECIIFSGRSNSAEKYETCYFFSFLFQKNHAALVSSLLCSYLINVPLNALLM